MNRRSFVASVGMICGFSGCLRIQGEETPMETGNAVPATDSPGNSTEGSDSSDVSLSEEWSFADRVEWASRVENSGGRFYVSLMDPIGIVALSSDGEQLWMSDSYETVGYYPTEFDLNQGSIVLGLSSSRGGRVVGFSQDTGEKNWTVDTPSYHDVSHVAIDSTTAYAATVVRSGIPDSSDNKHPNVYAFDLATGEQKWVKKNLGGSNYVNGLSKHEEYLYTSHSGGIDLFDAESGDLRENLVSGEYRDGGTTVSEGVAYVGEYPVRALSLPRLDTYWSTDIRVKSSTNPAVDSRYVAFALQGEGVVLLDAQTGDPLWEVETLTEVRNQPTIGTEYLWVIDTAEYLYAFDLESGEEMLRREGVSDYQGGTAFFDETLLVLEPSGESSNKYTAYQISS